MAPPVAVYVVAAVVSVAALFAFKEFVYEPHIAPAVEAWAEDFLERRRAARNRRASAVPVNTSRRRRRRRESTSSHHSNDAQGDHNGDRTPPRDDVPVQDFELEPLVSREVDEWRNEVLRSQERDGLRRRKTDRIRDEFDGFESTSTTLDESFTSLTHTPHAYVISNISSPATPSTVSLPDTPNHRRRSESQSTTTQRDVVNLLIDHSPPPPIHEIPPSPSRTPLRPLVNGVDATSPTPLAIPNVVNHSFVHEVPRPLPFTPTYQIMGDDSPFGPLLPDTPGSSAEMYGDRPFSPLTRVMGSGVVFVSGSSRTHSSMTSSVRTLGGSGVLRSSGLANEIIADDQDHLADASTPTHPDLEPDASIISSLSERYPAPPTPPVMISPPASSIGLLSAPSTPRSTPSSAVTSPQPVPRTWPSVPALQLPPDSPPRQLSEQVGSATGSSPAMSYVSFLSPMPVSRTASSDADEFMSVASDESGWSVGGGVGVGVVPVQDRGNNPFLDGGEGSEGSEVLVEGHEGSEAGSDESWGSARRH